MPMLKNIEKGKYSNLNGQFKKDIEREFRMKGNSNSDFIFNLAKDNADSDSPLDVYRSYSELHNEIGFMFDETHVEFDDEDPMVYTKKVSSTKDTSKKKESSSSVSSTRTFEPINSFDDGYSSF